MSPSPRAPLPAVPACDERDGPLERGVALSPVGSIRSLPTRLAVTVLVTLLAAGRLYFGRGVAAAVTLGIGMVGTMLLVPLVARWALKHGIVALPGGRDIHLLPTPRAGGIAVFVPIALILTLWTIMGSSQAPALLVGGTLIFACGLLDDVKRASPGVKIFFQVVAGIVLVLFGFRLPALGIPGIGELALGDLEIPVIIFWIVLATNAVNLSDGLDGLATSLTVVGMGAFVVGGVPSALPIALAGACLGFFYHNYPRARIFLGDSGSLFLGFILAGLALELPTATNVPVALAALAYPLGDVFLVVLRRWIRGKPFAFPDRSHVHHRALLYLGHPLYALVAVVSFAAMHAFVGVYFPGLISLGVSFVLWFAVALLLLALGKFHPGRAIAGRRRMRRLHGLQTYVSESISLARSMDDLTLALQHFVEGGGLCAVTVDGLTVANREGCVCGDADAACDTYSVPSRHGPCSWRGTPTTGDSSFDEERETVIAAVLRLAAGRIRGLVHAGAELGRRPRAGVGASAGGARAEDSA